MIDFRKKPSRMEVAGWALLGFLPAALKAHSLVGAITPLIALAIVAARMRHSVSVLFGALAIFALLFFPIAIMIAAFFMIDPRYVDQRLGEFIPAPLAFNNPSGGKSPYLLSFAFAIWNASFGGIALFIAEKTFDAKAIVGCISGFVALALIASIHLMLRMHVRSLGYQGEQTESIFASVSTYVLIAMYPAFFLALFHSYFPKRAVKPQGAINEK